MRGRKPMGPSEVTERLEGSDQAKLRVKVVLQTLAGQLRVQEACALLQISEQRFDELRLEAVQGAIEALEPQPVGRRPRPAANAEVAALQERIAELEVQVQAASVRAEVAASLPRHAPRSKKAGPRTKRR